MTSDPPLRGNRDFRLFLASHVCNESGAALSRIALPLLAAVALSASPLEMGLLTAASGLAFLLLGLPAGAWVDRVRRRRVMIAADLARSALLGSVTGAWVLGVLDIPLLIAAAFLAGCAQLFGDVADQSHLPAILPRDRLVAGNGRLELVRTATGTGGAGAGGAVVQAVGAPFAVLCTALASLASALLLFRIRAADPAPEPRPGRPRLRTEIAEGLSFVLGHPVLRVLIAHMVAATAAISALLALQMLYLSRTLGLPPLAIGLVLTVPAAAAALAALGSGPLARRLGDARLARLAPLLCFPFALLYPLAQPDWRLAVYIAALCVVNAGVILFNVTQVSYRQAVCPPRLLARVNATVRFAAWGTAPLGALAGGMLGEALGVRGGMAAGAAVLAAAPLLLLLPPLGRMRAFPVPPDHRPG